MDDYCNVSPSENIIRRRVIFKKKLSAKISLIGAFSKTVQAFNSNVNKVHDNASKHSIAVEYETILAVIQPEHLISFAS